MIYVGIYIGLMAISLFATFVTRYKSVQWRMAQISEDRRANFDSYWSAKRRALKWEGRYTFWLFATVALSLIGIGAGVFSVAFPPV